MEASNLKMCTHLLLMQWYVFLCCIFLIAHIYSECSFKFVQCSHLAELFFKLDVLKYTSTKYFSNEKFV